jgi:hypothetical protein
MSDQSEQLLKNGEKYALVALRTRAEVPAMFHASGPPELWASSESPVPLGDHWEKWLAILAMLARKNALRVAPGGSAPPIPCVARRGSGSARSGRESWWPVKQESGFCAPAEIDKRIRPREHSGEAMPGSLGSIPG